MQTPMQKAKEGTPLKLVDREDLFSRMKEVCDSISRRAYEIFQGKGGTHGHDLEDWFQAESELLGPVPVEVRESNGDLIVRVETPGFSAKELQVSVEPRCLVIAGQRESAEEHKIGKKARRERSWGQIFRVVELPVEVNPAKATAALNEGILELRMPKAATTPGSRVVPIG
ncbi:MAG TPA: Hsp20 family protein [Bryobacterales bacterium]|nr:Hsp20 family protein [Bryobacterales bacterium]